MKVLTWFGTQSFLIFILLLLSSSNIKAQELSKDELEIQAKEFFESGGYMEAADDFEKLFLIYPKEASYNYYLGRCYLEINSNQEKSIKYLRYAASQNYNPDVHFYLALAYYNAYKFDEADVALMNFENLASKKTKQKHKAGELKASIARAREEVYMVRDIEVLSSESLKTIQLEGVYALHIDGKLANMPSEFMSVADKEKSYQGVMYYPSETLIGFKYYISSYGKNGKSGKDIYELSQITALDYSLPQCLGNINSLANEEYPYFDINTNTLYFSSDRIGGLGGYDIYYSEYNPDLNTFSPPKRFEFPINSAFDDFLYVPDSTKSSAIFLSNRLSYADNIKAFKIALTESPNFILTKSIEEINELAQLKIKLKDNAPVIVENLSPAVKPKVYSEYDLVLQEAMEKQLLCDSMQAELLSKKNHLRVAENMDDRRILIASITNTEAEVEKEQGRADDLFLRAQQLSNNKGYIPENQDNNENVVLEKEVNGMKVFSYLPEERTIELKKSEAQQEKLKEEEKTKLSQFVILNSSPYSETSPIPEDEKIPGGLIYRIQLGAFGKKLPMNAFGGLSPVSAEIIEERNLTKYYVGYFVSSKEARAALDEVKTYGFGDAFVVPYFEQKKITINAARELEFGQKLNTD